MRCAERPAHPWYSANPIVGAVREPPTTPAFMRREGVADNVHGGLSIIVACDSVCVSARVDDDGWWTVLFIGFVRRGGTGRGRFTNRPYGLYGRAERRVRVCVNRMLCDERPAHARHAANPIVGAVREPPTTRAVMRRDGVADNVRGGHCGFDSVSFGGRFCERGRRPSMDVVVERVDVPRPHGSWAVHEPPLRETTDGRVVA